MEALQLAAHLLAQLGVERADRLVHQHRLRPPHQRAADGDALHVAAGEVRRPLLEEMLDAERAWPTSRTWLSTAARLSRVGAERKGDVLVGGEVRIEREELEDEGDVAVAGLAGSAPACRRSGCRRCRSPRARRWRAASSSCRSPTDRAARRTPCRDGQVQLPDDVDVAEVLFDVAQEISAMTTQIILRPRRRLDRARRSRSRPGRPG